MKLIATGDWHACNFTDFSRKYPAYFNQETGRFTETTEEEAALRGYNTIDMNSRLHNTLNGICDMRDYAIKNGILDVLFAGDMFHKRGTIDVTVFNCMYTILKTFEKRGIEIHGIAGNHDDTSNEKIPQTSLHTLGSVMHVIETPEVFSISRGRDDVVQVVAIPYSKDKEFVINSIDELMQECEDDKKILLCHLGINGGKVGSGMVSMRDSYTLAELHCKKWDYLVAGHYHQPQNLAKNAIYPGTPVQNSFSDELPADINGGYNGFYVIDTDKAKSTEFVPITAPRFVTIESTAALNKLDDDFLRNNYIRIKADSTDVGDIKEILDEKLGESQNEVRLELDKNYSIDHRSEITVGTSFKDAVKLYAEERYKGNVDMNKVISVGTEIMEEVL